MIDEQPQTASDRMLDTAIRLFRHHGIVQTGVDQIIDESCSARGTLYHRFGSKSGLVAAALLEEGDQWRVWFFSEIEAQTTEPREQLLVMFDVLATWFRRTDYSGCLFMNAVAECRNQDSEIREATVQHKKQVNAKIRRIAKLAGATDPSQLTQQLDLLIDGLIITTMVKKSAIAVRNGKAAAKLLIDASIGE
jgi:AcrR family transcriptional regulator